MRFATSEAPSSMVQSLPFGSPPVSPHLTRHRDTSRQISLEKPIYMSNYCICYWYGVTVCGFTVYSSFYFPVFKGILHCILQDIWTDRLTEVLFREMKENSWHLNQNTTGPEDLRSVGHLNRRWVHPPHENYNWTSLQTAFIPVNEHLSMFPCPILHHVSHHRRCTFK